MVPAGSYVPHLFNELYGLMKLQTDLEQGRCDNLLMI